MTSYSTLNKPFFAVYFLLLNLFFGLAHATNQEDDPIGKIVKQTQKQNPIQKVSYSPAPKAKQQNKDLIGDLINTNNQFNQSSSNQELAQATLKYLGINYKYGGSTPTNGFDCSGLIQYVANKHLGLKLPRVASSMAQLGTSVSRDQLKAGDLVFFNTSGARYSHVGVYLGNNEFVHAPRTGSQVRIEKISTYWNKRYNGARRLEDNGKNILAKTNL